jgi:hypothetical protein
LTGQVNASRYECDVAAEMLFSNIVGNASASLIRKECIDRVGEYDTLFYERDAQGCEDRDLYLRVAEQYQFSVVRQIHVGYRISAKAMSCDHERMSRSHDVMIEKFRTRHPTFSEIVLRRSDAFFRLYLARISRRAGDCGASICYFLAAATKDPAFLLCRDFYVGLRVSFIHLIRKLVRKPGIPGRRGHRMPASSSLGELQRKAETILEPRAESLQFLRLKRIREARAEFVIQAGLESPDKDVRVPTGA